ncbi:MAG: hypothetical protein EBW19_09810 [Betaproteobacteria bacterium]|nr:hypothetical protein [Betaproteobacteria bacterium]
MLQTPKAQLVKVYAQTQKPSMSRPNARQRGRPSVSALALPAVAIMRVLLRLRVARPAKRDSIDPTDSNSPGFR